MRIMFVNSMESKKFKVNRGMHNVREVMLVQNQLHNAKAYKRNWFLTSNALPHACLYHGVVRFKLKISSAARIHNVANWVFAVSTRCENANDSAYTEPNVFVEKLRCK